MECFDYVARRNNEGVSLLLAGEDQAAVAAWTAALATAKDQLFRVQTTAPSPSGYKKSTTSSNSSVASVSTTTTYATSFSDTSSLASTDSMPLATVATAAATNTTPTGSNNGGSTDASNITISASFLPIANLQAKEFFIANHAVSIPPLDCGLGCNGEGNMRLRAESAAPVYMACVILNLALAYHRQGMKNSGRRSCINKAEKMYDMVIKLINDATMKDVGIALVIKAMSINNISLIRYQKGEYDNARQGLDYLSYLLQSEKETCRRYLDEKTLNGLLLNIFLLLNISNIAPAA